MYISTIIALDKDHIHITQPLKATSNIIQLYLKKNSAKENYLMMEIAYKGSFRTVKIFVTFVQGMKMRIMVEKYLLCLKRLEIINI